MHVAAWILLGIPAMCGVTFLAGRLLGARRGWIALGISGVIGWSLAIVTAGELTNWEWATADMVLIALALGTLFTMAVALTIDLLSPVGSLAPNDTAGLFTIRNPIAATRRRIAPFRRYREVLSIARKEGVISRRVSAEHLPAGVRRTLESSGGIFIKLGQVASTRSDVLPVAWCEELALLRSSVEPQPEEMVRPHLTEHLGGPTDEFFETFDWSPIASASIAQIYRARLLDGTEVVVKVQRPGLSETIKNDRAAIMQIADLIQRRTTFGLSVQPAELAAEFIEGVEEELDFTIEASNASDLTAGLEGIAQVRVATIYPDLSTDHVLVEEYVAAPSIDDVAALDTAGIDRRMLAARLIEAFLHQIFESGVFHADPHPGNILVEPDGTIVLIDLGAVGRIGPGHRSAVLELLAAASEGDAVSLRQALERIAIFDRRLDTRALDAVLETFLAHYMRAGAGMTASAFEDLVSLIGDFGIRLPRWFGTLSRTMVSLEGTLTMIDPDFSLVDAARVHADQHMVRPSVSDLRSTIEHEAVHQLPRLRRLPERVDELFGQLLAGQLSASVSLLSDERDSSLLTRLVDRVVLAMIAASAGVGSTLLLGVESGPTLGGSVSINEVLGYFGLAAATALAFRIVAGVIRDGET
jgi:ubiquinone biosynthesis protein